MPPLPKRLVSGYMGRMSNITRRQHHVWRHHLEAWATGKKIFCLMDGKIFRPNTINVGVEGDFYKLKQLTDFDRQMLLKLIGQSPAQARETLMGFMGIFDGWHDLRSRLPPGRMPEVRAALDEYITTAEEKYHGYVEAKFVPHLAKLRLKDPSPLLDEDAAVDFSYFIALQWVRTDRVRKKIVTRDAPYDFGPMWSIASHITAANFGWTLFALREQNPIRLIVNDTDVPFITGDQPVVNLQATPRGDEVPDFLSLYYPVSPQCAVFINDYRSPITMPDTLTDPQRVRELNRHMALIAGRQVYASTCECLVPYLPPHTR